MALDEEKLLLKVQQIAANEGTRGRNEAFAVFALLALLISIGGFLSVGYVVNKAIEDAGLQSYVVEAEGHISSIEELTQQAETEFDDFQSSGGYDQFVSQLSELDGQYSVLSERISSPINSCRSITGSFDEGNSGDTCSNHSNWMGGVSCPSGEVMTAIQIATQRQASGTYRCAFRARCCTLLE